jgi:hypothetical protein
LSKRASSQAATPRLQGGAEGAIWRRGQISYLTTTCCGRCCGGGWDDWAPVVDGARGGGIENASEPPSGAALARASAAVYQGMAWQLAEISLPWHTDTRVQRQPSQNRRTGEIRSHQDVALGAGALAFAGGWLNGSRICSGVSGQQVQLQCVRREEARAAATHLSRSCVGRCQVPQGRDASLHRLCHLLRHHRQQALLVARAAREGERGKHLPRLRVPAIIQLLGRISVLRALRRAPAGCAWVAGRRT